MTVLRTLASTALAALALAANAAPGPYDERADARADLGAALSQAPGAGKRVLVVFGANWCTDCKVLDLAFKGGANAPLIERSFRVVKVDVGKFDRNVDIARTYGVDLRKGIPAVVVLSPAGKVLHATRAGELADARTMGDTAIHDFLARMAALDR